MLCFATQQATQCPGSNSLNSGSFIEHLAILTGQLDGNGNVWVGSRFKGLDISLLRIRRSRLTDLVLVSLLGASLMSFGIGIALVFDFKILVLALLFVAINIAYTFTFKTAPYLEIVLNIITYPLRFATSLWLAENWEHCILLGPWFLATLAITILKRIKKMREAGVAVRQVLRHYDQPTLKNLIAFCLILMLMIWPFTRTIDFVLTGV